jgi:hypothetical protein
VVAEDGVVVLDAVVHVVGVERAVGGVAGDFAALGAPAGKGDGDDDVVMLAGSVGAEADVALTRSASLRLGIVGIRPDHVWIGVFEGELQASEEIALGDVPGFAGAALLVAAGDVDRGDVAVEPGGAKHVDDGRAEACGVHGKRAIAGEVIMADDFADALDDARVGSAEGQAFDVPDMEAVEHWTLVRAE